MAIEVYIIVVKHPNGYNIARPKHLTSDHYLKTTHCAKYQYPLHLRGHRALALRTLDGTYDNVQRRI